MKLGLDKVPYHPFSEKIVDHLSAVTQNNNKHFFRVMLTYFWGMVNTHMRVGIRGWGNTVLPTNIYSICLSESGTGKGYTITTMEDQVMPLFRDLFLSETFIVAAEDNIYNLATQRANHRGTDADDEQNKLVKEYESAGPMLFRFAEGTTAAVKQLRHKMAIAQAGSLNFQVDEIGSNFLKEKEMVNLWLELYDTGKIQDKLVKNTSDNTRFERIEGATPSNALLCGSAATLLDGGETERSFFSAIEVGYGRRCFFAYSRDTTKVSELSAEQLVDRMFNKHHDKQMALMAEHIEMLADISNLNKEMVIDRDAAIFLMKYKMYCVERGSKMKDHQRALKAEIDNRYFKVLKLAACYAFIDDLSEINITYLKYAIKVAEQSGKDFAELMNPEKDYMKLAKFLVDFREEATLSDLDQYLPSFNGSKQKKDDQLTNAISWGYKNSIVISKRYQEQILFLKAEALEETNLDELIVSASDHPAYDYAPLYCTFEQLAEFGDETDYNWCNHHFHDEHRSDENVIPGFNVLVFDVDDGTPLSTAKLLFEDYYAIFYETKSSTPKFNRYRVMLPISHVLNVDKEEYKEIVNNVIESLPFDITIDDASNQPSKKWRTYDSGAHVNDVRYVNGQQEDPKLFDILPYIPRTTKNEQRMRTFEEMGDVDNLAKWVINNTGEGNRNKQLFRYAMVMVDMGYDYDSIFESVKEVNAILKDGLSEKELLNSIMKSVASKI